MPDSIIKIKCPQCGAVLSVQSAPGIENKNVTCPICSYKGRFTTYRAYVPKQSADSTNYGGSENTEFGGGGGHTKTYSAVLRKDDGNAIELKFGRNVIGRAAENSQADIQLDTHGDKHMSREHLLITINKVAGKGTTGYLSLYKEKVNKTYVNGSQLYYGDTLILKDGDKIQLPGMELIYRLIDDDSTRII